VEHATVKEGVANFRKFYSEVREFIVRSDTRELERKLALEAGERERTRVLLAHEKEVKLALQTSASKVEDKNRRFTKQATIVLIIIGILGLLGTVFSGYVAFRDLVRTTTNIVPSLSTPAPRVTAGGTTTP
jgi:biopolymer transport protein ExbB/TolQ